MSRYPKRTLAPIHGLRYNYGCRIHSPCLWTDAVRSESEFLAGPFTDLKRKIIKLSRMIMYATCHALTEQGKRYTWLLYKSKNVSSENDTASLGMAVCVVTCMFYWEYMFILWNYQLKYLHITQSSFRNEQHNNHRLNWAWKLDLFTRTLTFLMDILDR